MKTFERFFQVSIVILLIVAFLTVPNEDQYRIWLKNKVKSESNNFFVNLGVDLLGDMIINKTTKCQNMFLFSYCHTAIDSNNQISVIGIYNTFIPLRNNQLR